MMRVRAVKVRAVIAGLVMLAGPGGAGTVHAADPAPAKEDYERQVEDELGKLDEQLDELDKRLDAARGEARAKLERMLEDLRKKRAMVRRKLDALRAGGEAAWNELRNALENALREFRRALEKAEDEAPVET
jgi:chromosome segregation ATPase